MGLGFLRRDDGEWNWVWVGVYFGAVWDEHGSGDVSALFVDGDVVVFLIVFLELVVALEVVLGFGIGGGDDSFDSVYGYGLE